MKSSSGYIKVPFNAEDIEQANIKLPISVFVYKRVWLYLLISVIFVGFLIGVVVLIIMALNHFQPPTKGFSNRLLSLAYILPLLGAIILVMKIQNMIDHKLAYKKVGVFKITVIINLISAKVLVLDGWRIFRIDKYNAIFKSVAKSKIITIQKTATGQLLYDLTIND